MNSLLVTGSIIVTLALISYSFGIIMEQTIKKITPRILVFLTIGIILDITATAFMIVGSPNSPFTFHGFLGYSALMVMFIDVLMIWRFKFSNGYGIELPRGIHLYSRYAYLWWVIAYITGGLLVVMK